MKTPRLFPAIFALILAASSLEAQTAYTFTNIVDSSGPFSTNLGIPSINASGQVAFRGWLDAPGGGGIYTGAGGDLTTIALRSGFVSLGEKPSINAAGTVAFVGSGIGHFGANGIFTGDGNTTIPLYQVNDPKFSSFRNPIINAAGTVAFHAEWDAGGWGIYTGEGNAPTVIAEASYTGPVSYDSAASLNGSGTVAFLANLDGGESGIFTGNGGGLTAVALTNGPQFSGFTAPAINDAGTVAFTGLLEPDGRGIFTSSGGVLTPVALTTDPVFSSVDRFVSINGAGEVVFRGIVRAGAPGIFTGPDRVTDRVILVDDELFGSTVIDVEVGSQAINDLGQIAFRYRLADGRKGIAVATVPEPGSAALVALGLGLLVLRRRRGAGM